MANIYFNLLFCYEIFLHYKQVIITHLFIFLNMCLNGWLWADVCVIRTQMNINPSKHLYMAFVQKIQSWNCCGFINYQTECSSFQLLLSQFSKAVQRILFSHTRPDKDICLIQVNYTTDSSWQYVTSIHHRQRSEDARTLVFHYCIVVLA